MDSLHKAIFGAFVFLLFIAFAIVAYPVMVDVAESNRIAARTAEGVACTTASGATTCNVTLPSSHEHFDTTNMTVTETSPSSGARTATLDASDRVTVTVTGLTASTAYVFSVAYQERASNVSGLVSDVLLFLPNLFIIAAIVILIVAGILGYLKVKKVVGGQG